MAARCGCSGRRILPISDFGDTLWQSTSLSVCTYESSVTAVAWQSGSREVTGFGDGCTVGPHICLAWNSSCQRSPQRIGWRARNHSLSDAQTSSRDTSSAAGAKARGFGLEGWQRLNVNAKKECTMSPPGPRARAARRLFGPVQLGAGACVGQTPLRLGGHDVPAISGGAMGRSEKDVSIVQSTPSCSNTSAAAT